MYYDRGDVVHRGGFMKRAHSSGLGIALTLAAGLWGCGGDSTTAPTPTPTPNATPAPPASVQTLIGQGSLKLNANFFALTSPIAIPAPSDLEFIVDWTFTDSNMATFIASGSCDAAAFNNNQCTIVQRSTGTTPKPRDTIARGAAAGNYVFLVANAGPRSESISYQIFRITPPRASSAGPISQAAASHPISFTVLPLKK
jgi:hypothetical protein